MADERVDIVDTDNNVLYPISKQLAHKNGLLHQTVISEIIDSDGNWVMAKQSSDRQDAGQYVSPVGGHVKSGESTNEALKREAFEECGLKDFTFKFMKKCIYNREVLGRKENHYFMIYEIYSDDPIILNEESDSYKKFTKTELKQLLKDKPNMFGDAFFPVIKCCYPELLE